MPKNSSMSKTTKTILWIAGAVVVLIVLFKKKLVQFLDKDPNQDGIQWK